MPKRIAKTLSLLELQDLYPTVESAIRYLEDVRWNGEPVCAKCDQGDKITPQKKIGTYWCGSCRSYFTVFTNTPLERQKVDARKWLIAAYLMLTDRKGIAAMELSKKLKVHYRTAWYMLHRLREACAAQSALLSGIVEVDETFIGGKEKNKRLSKRSRNAQIAHEQKQVVLGMRQRGGKTVAHPIEGTDRLTLWNAIQRHIEPGSTLCTDDHPSYKGIERKRFTHNSVNHSDEEYVRGLIHTNGIESVWSIFKRSIHGTWHHLSFKYLSRYIDEAAFRLNEGNCQVDTADRMRALFGAMTGKSLTYKELTATE